MNPLDSNRIGKTDGIEKLEDEADTTMSSRKKTTAVLSAIGRDRISDMLWTAFLFAAFLTLYLVTMCPTVYWGDSAEFAWVPATGGIVHPTGYPLFTLLCRLSSTFPWSEPAQAANAVSATAGACAVSFCFILCRSLGADIGASVAGAVLLGLDSEVWMQASAAEVYTLHLAFTAAAFASAMRGRIVLLSLVVGLSLANHLTTVLWLPSLFVVTLNRLPHSPKKLAWCASVLLIGLSLYSYLPVVSSGAPSFDQGDPETMRAFLDHVTGAQYRYRMLAADWHEFIVSARSDLESLLSRASWIGVLLGLLGLAVSLGSKGKDLARGAKALALLALVVAGFTFAYDIPDRSGYLLPVDLVLCAGTALAVKHAGHALRAAGKARLAGVGAVGLVLACSTAARYVDGNTGLAGDRSLEGYAKAVLSEAPPRSVVFFEDLEEYHGVRYMQEMHGYRTDVTAVSEYLLRLPWYLRQLHKDDPGLVIGNRVKWALENGLEALAGMSRREQGRESQKIVNNVERELIASNIESRVVCRCPHRDEQWLQSYMGYYVGFTGLLYVLSKEPPHMADFPLSHLPPSPGADKSALKSPRQRYVQSRYATAYNRRGIIRAKLGRLDDAIDDIRISLEYDPDYEAALNNLKKLTRIRNRG